tara:strand:+ start:485 stop:1480 length:996 start_codon:yes stop_codon:yes gene_type:complete
MKKKIQKNEKIFVAGARGMVGNAICKVLRKNGYGELGGGAILTPSRAELNLLNTVSVKEWFDQNKPTIVIIAAAKVGGILANSTYPTEFLLENLKIQNNLIETSWQNKIKRLLFLGSSCIYPKFANQPIEEESLLTGELEETNQPYAIAKIAGIKLCEALRKQYNFDAISLMPTNLYGKGDNYDNQSSHVMASFIKRFYEASIQSLSSVTCWGSGTALREFMHVDDLGDAVLHALEYWDPDSKDAPMDKFKNPIYLLNVGTGVDISIKKLASKISKIVEYKGEILWDKSKPDGTPKKLLNINKIKSIGWEPKISLEAGIIKTIKDYEVEYG